VANGADLSAGVMVGEYRVEGQLGSGPSGRVHSAVHAVVSRRAAIKVLHPDVAATREVVEKYFAEVRAANQLGHPNVVDVFGFGKLADGRSYVVMEWLRGESLRERATRTRMPIAEGLAIISTITLALAEAHDKGIVHRNLKPENIFLVEVKGERPQVKLLDFGTAELLGSRAEDRKGSALAYISPEQARGEAAEPGTDIYALGAIAFELITGKPVFEAKTTAEIVKKHVDEKPRKASSLNSEVPAQLDAVIASMLAKTAAERPALDKIRSELRACRLLVGGALTPPAGLPIVPLPETAAKTDAKKDAKKDAKDAKPAGKDAKTDAKAGAKADAKADAKSTAKAAEAKASVSPQRPDAPTSKSGAIVAIILLVAATIGIGIWIYMNQRNAPIDDAPAAPAAPAGTPAPAAAPAGSADPAAAPATAPADPAQPAPAPATAPTDPAQPAPATPPTGAFGVAPAPTEPTIAPAPAPAPPPSVAPAPAPAPAPPPSVAPAPATPTP
jgi:serine/threonine-protein kinase